MIRNKLIFVVSVCTLVLSACGSGSSKTKAAGTNGTDPGAGTGQSAPLTADEKACGDFYQVQLAWTGRCGGVLNGSEPAIARFRTVCARELGAPGADALRDARAKCSEKMKTAACDDALPECDLPAGTLENNAACAGRSQCKSRYCKLDNSGCGTCQDLVAAGGDCTSPADCAFGANEVTSCDYANAQATTGKCSVWKLAKAGDTCSAQSFCDTQSHCDVPDKNATQGTCLANVDVGKDCDDTRACRPGLVCTKQKCANKPKEGDACAAVDDCDNGLACDGTCKQVVYVGVREACDTVHRCARGRCVQPVTTGSNGQTTPSGQANCVDPIEDGQICGADLEAKGMVCDLFAQCVGGKCHMEDPSECK